jgi:hypothetical protein
MQNTDAPLLPRPANLQVEENMLDITFQRKWFSPVYIIMLVFSFFWNGFLIFWYSTASQMDGPLKWIFLLFPLLHVAAGVSIFYIGIAGLVNKTIFKVDKMELSVKHTPLPWTGNKTVSRSDLKQFYTKKTISHGRNSTTITYDLMAITRDDSIEKILTGLTTPEEPKYIERKIENFWNITDVRVEGEYMGD